MAKRNALGKGLSSILGDMDEIYNKELGLNPNTNQEISLELIKTNPHQPRKYFDENSLNELANSIKEYGLLQPIIVYQKEDFYILVAGERRFRACQKLKMSSIKALIADINEEKLRELALIENIQRENLNPIELAHSYKELIDHYNITQEELSFKIHKSRPQITNTLRLLSLDEKTQNLIAEGKISQGHAKVMVGLDKKNEKLVLNTILGQKLNVQETEKLIQNIKKIGDSEEIKPLNDELYELKNKFKKIGIDSKARQNRITLYLDDIEKIKKLNKILE